MVDQHIFGQYLLMALSINSAKECADPEVKVSCPEDDHPEQTNIVVLTLNMEQCLDYSGYYTKLEKK